MKISITVKPKSKKPRVEKIDNEHFVVAVKEPPEKGKANEAVIRAISDYFQIAPSNVQIVRGQTSRHKEFMISGRII